MPTCRRKRVLLTEPSQALRDALKTDPHKEVYYMSLTGEIFETYEYASPRSPPPLLPAVLSHMPPQRVRGSDVLL